MDVKAGKSELQSAKKGPSSSSNSARRRTLGSDSTRDYTGVEALSPHTLLVCGNQCFSHLSSLSITAFCMSLLVSTFS